MPINLDGILLPVTTPFTPTEDFDAESFTNNLEKWNVTGVIGYVVLGSTGERVNLDEREYVQVIQTARRAVPETMSFIVGAGQQSTRGTISEIETAANAGAEAVLVITPHYYRSAVTQDALVRHYTAAADASPIPIILYSMPDLTGITIEPETAARLSEHKNIIGIKDSSPDVAKLAEVVRRAPHDFAVMIGNGAVLCEALQAGARGGILAVACVVPQLCLEIYRAVEKGEIDRAKRLQERLSPLARAVTKTYGIGGLKTAMEMVGFAGGAVRQPLQRPNETATAEIERLISAATGSSVAGSPLAHTAHDA
ncbi:MAG TPA: dihydrodipicolinate synthase family protein [Pyrinomonadaceae bacterium]|nr:dihydrodipicolinate synthase family protein [Pyrinomonadaceae bacterium]